MFFLIILVYSCSLSNLDENDEVEINLSTFNLEQNDTLIIELKNKSSKQILIYWNSLNSPIQKKDSLNNWKSISFFKYEEDSLYTFVDYYSHLNPGEPYYYNITQEMIYAYVEDIRGTYRVVFSLIINEDYQNRKSLISDEFNINY